MKNSKLRGLIYGAYPSISAFARAIKWYRKKASRIVNDSQEPTTQDIKEMAELFNISNAADFVNIFFDDVSTMRTNDPLNFLLGGR